ncbi:unnamed protein product [Leptidea sinapis]|uniref:Uncharacterized protein n=1 Tax=Leptidea sinapis TaxID=189913 RepID=A0A5E4R269_9NEOP|nr:unnamed protein product [Leptidea sinapis]
MQSRIRSTSYYDQKPRIDSISNVDSNQYSHERRNLSDSNQIHVLNGTDYDYVGFGAGDVGEKYLKTIPRPALGYNKNTTDSNISLYRSKRSDNLMGTVDSDQVDSRGIPSEAKLWNLIQTSVNSQQSRALIRDQVRTCFQQQETDSEYNGCSYSNKIEKCMMLRLTERKNTNSNSTNNGK